MRGNREGVKRGRMSVGVVEGRMREVKRCACAVQAAAPRGRG